MRKRVERGGLGLGDLFHGVADLIDLLKEMEAEGKTERTRTGEITGSGQLKDLKGVYGFSVKVGLGGTPTVETFGNIRKSETGPVVEEVREPLVDLFDEGDVMRVIAELPGVESTDIATELEGDILTITSRGKAHKYQKEVLLPSKGQADSLKTSYRNGILEITLRKTRDGA